MAQVSIRINGYAYSVGCEDGQEQHLEAMAREVDQRIEELRAGAGSTGEARMLVLAALMLADERHDLVEEFTAMRRQLGRLEAAQGQGAASDPKLGRRLSKLAQRAEEIAAGLEHP
jgi:cell division protein ZapA